jgi:hypothetical protein
VLVPGGVSICVVQCRLFYNDVADCTHGKRVDLCAGCCSLSGDMAGGFVQDGCNILQNVRNLDGGNITSCLTFRLYLVVTLVARTPFLMLLVARWFKTVWLG